MTSEPPQNLLHRLDLGRLPVVHFRRSATSRFMTLEQDFAAQGDGAAAEVASLLAHAVNLHLREEERDQPYGPNHEFIGVPLFDLATLTPETPARLTSAAAELLRAVLAHTEHPALQARAADLLWTFERDFRAGAAAVHHCLAWAQAVVDDDWMDAVDALTRAHTLAPTRGRRQPEVQTVRDAVVHHLSNPALGDTWGANRLLGLLLRDGEDAADWAALATRYAEEHETNKQWYLSNLYWHMAGAWLSKAGQHDEARRALIRAAEVRVLQADEALERTGRHLDAVPHLEHAIRELRAVSETRSRVFELRRRLLTHQEHSVSELTQREYRFPVDERELERVRAVFRGQSLTSALQHLGAMAWEESYDALQASAQDQVKQFAVLSLMPTRQVNDEGRTVVTSGPDGARVQQAMFDQQNLNYTVRALPAIQAARLALLEEHDVRTEDLLPILQACPLIRPDHIRSVCTGLIAGFYGDFLSAAHLLTPQLETALRELVDLNGGFTSRLDADGTQDAVDLGSLLRPGEQAALLEEVLGPDLLFQLRGFLVERHGVNFRNKIAHGLAGDPEVNGLGPVAWHLMWQLIVGFARLGDEAAAESSGQAEAVSGPLSAAPDGP